MPKKDCFWRCKNCGRSFSSWSGDDAICPFCDEKDNIEGAGTTWE